MRIPPIHDGELVVLGLAAWGVGYWWAPDWRLGFLLLTVAVGSALGHRAHWAWRVGEWEDECERRLEEIERSTRKAPGDDRAA